MPQDPQFESDLPTGIGNPARRAFANEGITRLDQFTTLREADLLRVHGVGPKAIGVIRLSLAERGLSFASVD